MQTRDGNFVRLHRLLAKWRLPTTQVSWCVGGKVQAEGLKLAKSSWFFHGRRTDINSSSLVASWPCFQKDSLHQACLIHFEIFFYCPEGQGPLCVLLPLPAVLFPTSPSAGSLSHFWTQPTCHPFGEALLDHPVWCSTYLIILRHRYQLLWTDSSINK